uniref:Putative CP n=1 Tax=Podosphaera partitivirus A TaxID=2592709 RepID=A0A7G3KJQ4_9VIRU|nr:putative CP [Podosphaera partitivirus A]
MTSAPFSPWTSRSCLPSLSCLQWPHRTNWCVSPTLPRNTCHRFDGYMLNSNIPTVLPNIPFYMEILNQVLLHDADYTEQEMRTFHRSIMNQNSALNATTAAHLYSSGAWSHVLWSLSQLNTAQSALASFDFPPALDVTGDANDITKWQQFLRFYHIDGSFYPWFGSVVALMQRYYQFFSESVPLSAISPSGAAISIPIWIFLSNNHTFVRPYTFVPAVPGVAPAHYRTRELCDSAELILPMWRIGRPKLCRDKGMVHGACGKGQGTCDSCELCLSCACHHSTSIRLSDDSAKMIVALHVHIVELLLYDIFFL